VIWKGLDSQAAEHASGDEAIRLSGREASYRCAPCQPDGLWRRARRPKDWVPFGFGKADPDHSRWLPPVSVQPQGELTVRTDMPPEKGLKRRWQFVTGKIDAALHRASRAWNTCAKGSLAGLPYDGFPRMCSPSEGNR
jgi:hypothetical protein